MRHACVRGKDNVCACVHTYVHMWRPEDNFGYHAQEATHFIHLVEFIHAHLKFLGQRAPILCSAGLQAHAIIPGVCTCVPGTELNLTLTRQAC